jgi:hypothetical protein
MNRVHVVAIFFIIILIFTAAATLVAYSQSSNSKNPAVYVGIAFGGTTVEQAEHLIERVKTYTNLFILNAGRNSLSINQTSVIEICDYATNHGLSLIVNLGVKTKESPSWQLEFFNNSKDRYGEKFLGVYYDDEPMGIPFDWDWSGVFRNGSDSYKDPYLPGLRSLFQRIEDFNQTGKQPLIYDIEAQWYHDLLMRNRGHNILKANNITTFTSDYLLYWYDFLGNYDTIFAQIGWNTSLINQQIAQIRGAATLQNKTWGTIITWSNKEPPYLSDGQTIYDQMVTSYNAGAKYVILFNYPYNDTGNSYGILTNDHFTALERFWNQVATKSEPTTAHAEAALILSKDYGWGMRNLNDKIWGIWPADEKAPIIWNNTEKLLNRYGLKLDIIYADPAFPVQGNYSKIFYWNQTLT